ncbi:hypothetical protein LEM8419_02370 [Neolewinella maritima]|uniref:NfeD-like C-terminal domain-containing protein n=1 Tax=Neolewinella maritima TaxID=1383882 RepID=A0ABM9B2B8_9BACT|nr:hypothetical protein [Neolewinella maritima]CAH1001467.1 hypothetical protein LEM8419_02370 [Neolewinella maritima]
MASTCFREEQRFRNPGLLALLGLFSVLAVYRLTVLLVVGATVAQLAVLALIGAVIGVAWYFVLRSRLRIKVSARHLKVKTKGILLHKLKLPTKDMVDCTYVDVAPGARWSGTLTHPASDFTSIDFGGRRGICVRMRNGKSYFIGSDELYARRDELPLPTPDPAS